MSIFLEIDHSRIDVYNYNNDFLLLKSDDMSKLRMVGKAIFERQFDFITEVIVTEVELCLQLNSKFNTSKLKLLQNITQFEAADSRLYRLPVYFKDSEDWPEVEKITGFSKVKIISKLKDTHFSIAMFGFLPGFLYLKGLEKTLHVPRKTVPSKYIQANSLAIGGQYLGLYSLDSPGGWHVIGQSPISILQIPQLPPVALNLNDRLKLCPIEKEEYRAILTRQLSLKQYNA